MLSLLDVVYVVVKVQGGKRGWTTWPCLLSDWLQVCKSKAKHLTETVKGSGELCVGKCTSDQEASSCLAPGRKQMDEAPKPSCYSYITTCSSRHLHMYTTAGKEYKNKKRSIRCVRASGPRQIGDLRTCPNLVLASYIWECTSGLHCIALHAPLITTFFREILCLWLGRRSE